MQVTGVAATDVANVAVDLTLKDVPIIYLTREETTRWKKVMPLKKRLSGQ